MNYKILTSLVLICLLMTISAIAAGETKKESSFWGFLTDIVNKITSVFIPQKNEAATPADQTDIEAAQQQTISREQVNPSTQQTTISTKEGSADQTSADTIGSEEAISVDVATGNQKVTEMTEEEIQRRRANSSCITTGVCQPQTEEDLKMESGVCGDGVCGYGEDCSNCVSDCDKCSNFDLKDFPKNLIKDGKFDALIVLGDMPTAADVKGPLDLANRLSIQQNENGTYFIKVEGPKMAGEIKNIRDQNMIIIGNPCDNSMARSIIGKKDDCHYSFENSKGKIKVYEGNGKITIIVAGYEKEDTNKALNTLKDYGNGKLNGREVII